MQCSWRITTDKKTVVLNFTDFVTEEYDRFSVIDDTNRIRTFSGARGSFVILSNDRELSLQFVSDMQDNRRGFHIIVRAYGT